MRRGYRLAYLVTHPIQYQAPLLRHIAAQPGIDLTVFFLSDCSVRGYHDPGFDVQLTWDVPLLDGYRYVFLPSVGRRDRLSFWRPMAYGLSHHLKAGGFDALWIHGYGHQVCLGAIAVAKWLGMRVLLRGESHLRNRPRSLPRVWIKRTVLPTLFKAIDGFLAIGTLNREYYLHYRVPEARIFMMPYAVDNAFFRTKATDSRPLRESLRAELGLDPSRPVVLYASKLQRGKRAADLLEAYVRLSSDGAREPDSYLLFVGDGEERPRLEARVRSLGWSSARFQGFKNQTELPRYYDLCDVFVLPSERETWGLVVNEVMNAGKPVIVSNQVGAAADLVKDGGNGFIVPVGDVFTLADRLRQLTGNPGLARRMGEESLRRIAGWNFDADVEGLIRALDAVVASRGV